MGNDLHSGHRLRIKERFLADGLDGFEPHNVLELLLFYALPRVDTNEIAHRLINRFGSLPEVFDAPYEELCKVKGVSEHAATLLKLIPELSRVYSTGRDSDAVLLDSSRKIGEFLVKRFIGRTKECVYLLCLDHALKLIHCGILTEGSVDSANVDIKSIVERALRHNAARVLLAHNHPRGLAVPSNEDVLITREIKRGLAYLDIELVDHIIVAGNDWYSLAEHYPNL